MDWLYVGVVLNSILTSGYPSEEACLGHKDMLEKQKIYGTCIKSPANLIGYGSPILLDNGRSICITGSPGCP